MFGYNIPAGFLFHESIIKRLKRAIYVKILLLEDAEQSHDVVLDVILIWGKPFENILEESYRLIDSFIRIQDED